LQPVAFGEYCAGGFVRLLSVTAHKDADCALERFQPVPNVVHQEIAGRVDDLVAEGAGARALEPGLTGRVR